MLCRPYLCENNFVPNHVVRSHDDWESSLGHHATEVSSHDVMQYEGLQFLQVLTLKAL